MCPPRHDCDLLGHRPLMTTRSTSHNESPPERRSGSVHQPWRAAKCCRKGQAGDQICPFSPWPVDRSKTSDGACSSAEPCLRSGGGSRTHHPWLMRPRCPPGQFRAVLILTLVRGVRHLAAHSGHFMINAGRLGLLHVMPRHGARTGSCSLRKRHLLPVLSWCETSDLHRGDLRRSFASLRWPPPLQRVWPLRPALQQWQ